MNHLATLETDALPTLPLRAEAWMVAFRSGAPTEPLTDEVREAARAALPAYEAKLNSAGPEAWERFLLPLGMAVRNPPAPQDIRRFASVCATVLNTVPLTALTPANQSLAARQFQFWPAIADLAALLEPGSRDLREDVAALRRMAEAPARIAPPVESAETRAANAEKNRLTVAALHAEMDQREREARPSGGKTQPNPISPERRIADYRRLGQHAVADAIAKHHGIEA